MSEEVFSKLKGLYVKVKQSNNKNEEIKNLDDALKKLKRKIKDDELLLKIQETSYYTKPSELRRNKKSKAKLRARSAENRKK